MPEQRMVHANVKYAAGPPKFTDHGPRINVLFIGADGVEYRVWGNEGDPDLTSLKKGNHVNLAVNERGQATIVKTAFNPPSGQPPALNGAPIAPAAPPPEPVPFTPMYVPEPRFKARTKDERITELVDDYLTIYKALYEQLSGQLLAEQIVPIATSVFINLEKEY